MATLKKTILLAALYEHRETNVDAEPFYYQSARNASSQLIRTIVYNEHSEAIFSIPDHCGEEEVKAAIAGYLHGRRAGEEHGKRLKAKEITTALYLRDDDERKQTDGLDP